MVNVGGYNTWRSTHLLPRILKFMWNPEQNSVTYAVQMVPMTHYSLKAASLKRLLVQNGEWNIYCKGREVGKKPLTGWAQLADQLAILSFWWPPTIVKKGNL